MAHLGSAVNTVDCSVPGGRWDTLGFQLYYIYRMLCFAIMDSLKALLVPTSIQTVC